MLLAIHPGWRTGELGLPTHPVDKAERLCNSNPGFLRTFGRIVAAHLLVIARAMAQQPQDMGAASTPLPVPLLTIHFPG